jgi:hypothetical protein
MWRRTITHLKDKPPSEVDTAHWFGTIWKPRREWKLHVPIWSRPNVRECSKEESKRQCGEHDSYKPLNGEE